MGTGCVHAGIGAEEEAENLVGVAAGKRVGSCPASRAREVGRKTLVKNKMNRYECVRSDSTGNYLLVFQRSSRDADRSGFCAVDAKISEDEQCIEFIPFTSFLA
jgi:hypothetical protein